MGTDLFFGGLLKNLPPFPAMKDRVASTRLSAPRAVNRDVSCSIGTSANRLPQRGCVRQPRVAARPLPWGTICHVINPNGVASGEGGHYAAIVIIRSERIPGVSPQPRHGLGRTVWVGMTQPRRGWGLGDWGFPQGSGVAATLG